MSLWDDLDAEYRKPGPTMTITKAQYLALRYEYDTFWAQLIGHGPNDGYSKLLWEHMESQPGFSPRLRSLEDDR